MEYFDVLDERGFPTGEVESRESCHQNGYWHKAVYAFIFDKDNRCLLQKRSVTKKLWPNKWDVSVGGHVLTGEKGYEALIRESKEELGLTLEKKDLTYLGGSLSTNIEEDIINNHFNECYIINKTFDINSLKLQEEEVSLVKWWGKDEILNALDNEPQLFADKRGPWENLKRYYKFLENKTDK